MPENKEHLLAVAQAAYDHVDMLWQEEYFELWDNHLTPLFASLGTGEALGDDARGHYFKVRGLCYRNADAWNQEDWYEMCDETFALVLDVALQEGWAKELPTMFPEVYRAV